MMTLLLYCLLFRRGFLGLGGTVGSDNHLFVHHHSGGISLPLSPPRRCVLCGDTTKEERGGVGFSDNKHKGKEEEEVVGEGRKGSLPVTKEEEFHNS